LPTTPIASLREHFGAIEDPRIDRTKHHQLIDILMIAICGIICGAEDWTDMEAFGRSKETWLRQFLELANGIPSHDTFRRVFMLLDSEQFETSFLQWIQAVMQVTGGQVVAIDGKQLRRSHNQTSGKEAIRMVSAWATENKLVLGQVKVDSKSNEITAIPALLEVLELKGCIVTIDAIGTQKEIAEAIIAKEADYVLPVKENQRNLYDEVEATFDEALQINFEHVPHDTFRTVDKGHGRLEVRQCWAISRDDYLNALGERSSWRNLNTIGMIRSERSIGNEPPTVTTRYYISSLKANAEQLLQAVRSHWAIENDLHWSLDVTFHEDLNRVRMGNGAENFAVLRHIALNLLKQEKTLKLGLKGKRLKASWDENYLLKVLTH
jgi:predicted transposase YbfD/YdcC